jgi:O-antigen/teichoic acid export membrane protein
MLKTVFTYGVYGFMIFVASKLLFYSSSVIIGKMVGISEVTYYAIPASLLIYVEAVIWSMLQVLIPVISGYDATGNVAGNQRLYVLGTRYSLAVSLPVMVTLFAVGDVFIANWMGEEYAAKGAFVLQVLVIGYLFQISRFVAEIILKGTNRHNVLALILLAQAVVGIVAGVLLAPRYGINGVALGTTIPLVVSSLVLVPIYTCKVLGISPLRFFRDGPAVPAILTGLFALVHWLIAPRVETYLDIVFYATMATTFFGLASWFLVLEEDHRETLVGQLRRLSWWRKSD